jgi:hypothetical protein
VGARRERIDVSGRYVVSALTTLLEGLVDYAGLFPPAALPMDDAVRNYAKYRSGAQREMLGRFVLPVQRLEEFRVEALRVDAAVSRNGAASRDGEVLEAGSVAWPLAVLAGAGDAATIAAFNLGFRAQWVIDTVEAKAATREDVRALAAAYQGMSVYVEVPLGPSLEELVVAIGESHLRAKIRTGGVTAEMFPAPEQVLEFLEICVRRQVPFKATAGLHHPLRGEYALTYDANAARGTMYGFLHVFLAAVLLHSGHEPKALLPLLEERDVTTISTDANGISWRDFHVSAAQVAQARARFAGSFGSCSFEEPVQDLKALSMLPTSL